jgi:hypothetical protein
MRGAAGAPCFGGPCAHTDVLLDHLVDQALGAADAGGEVAKGGEGLALAADGDQAVAGGLPVEAGADGGLEAFGVGAAGGAGGCTARGAAGWRTIGSSDS